MHSQYPPSRIVFSDKLVVFADDRLIGHRSARYQCTSCTNIGLAFLGSTMKDDSCLYIHLTVSKPFHFPPTVEPITTRGRGRAYHDHRAALMVARNEGMTKTYNRFHDPTETAEDIQRLRELHAAMDRAVLEAYGWHDLAARAEPIFLDETNEDDHTYQGRLFWPSDFRDEVLARLLALNAERHAEEVRLGIAPGMKGRREDAEDDLDETD